MGKKFNATEILWYNYKGSVPSKIFVSRLVSKKCHQDEKKLRRFLQIFLKCIHFKRKYFSSTIVGE